MVLHISLVGICLASVALESVLYGFFAMLSFTSIYLLFAREKLSDRPRSSKAAVFVSPLIFTNISMTVTVTAHWVCSLVRLFKAFLGFNNGDTPAAYYGDLTQPMFIANTALVIVSLIIGDSVMIYRMRTVFNYNRSVIVLPVCALCGFIACGFGITFQFSKISPNHDVFLSSIGTIFTLITNVYCSTFIAWKIYRVNSAASNYSGQNLSSITSIIVESAILYTSWTIIFMGTYIANSNLQFLIIDTIPAITGISFTLINVRIGLGWAQNIQKTTERSTGHSISVGLRPNPARDGDERNRGSNVYPMRSLAVRIERTVVKDVPSDLVPHEPSRKRDFDLASDAF